MDKKPKDETNKGALTKKRKGQTDVDTEPYSRITGNERANEVAKNALE
jgi:hypothetical protein